MSITRLLLIELELLDFEDRMRFRDPDPFFACLRVGRDTVTPKKDIPTNEGVNDDLA